MLRIAYAPLYAHSLPAGHRFPMAKYELIPEQLVRMGVVHQEAFYAPTPLAAHWVLRTHDAEYLRRLHALELTPAEVRRIGFPLSAELVHREVCIAEGTVRCTHFAREHGVALNVAGGTHHAYADRGEGFCLLNDQAIAANYLLDTGAARRILIVDLDVHQGNGTAKLFENVPEVFTFSMHGAANYPQHKEHSDLDIALPTGTGDAEYLDQLTNNLPNLLEQHRPDFAFYLAGVDVLATDKLGHLALTPEGVAARDRYVLATVRDQGIPVVVCMGGGYSPRLADIVNAHVATFAIAADLYGN